jgi:hypothetical protein
MSDVAAALRYHGVDATLLDVDVASSVLKDLVGRGFCLIDGNHRIQLAMPVPRFSMMVDHPCTRLGDLKIGHPQVEVLGWVDATHPEAATALGLPYRSIFLPHAGSDPVKRPLPMAERDIDIFFPGTLKDTTTRDSWRAGHPEVPAAFVDLLFDTVERIETGLEPAIPAFLASCTDHRIDVKEAFSRDTFCGTVSRALEIAEMNRRMNVLSSLPDVRICIASDGDVGPLRDRHNITHVGFIDDFAEIRRLMARSKIVLNVTAKFPRGSHERIWYGMAEGAVILTENSAMLQQDFKDGESILCVPQKRLEPEDMEFLTGLLGEPARLERIARIARGCYRARHTWKQRVEPMWSALKAVAAAS